ncbi:molybdate ABC transporter substrate-binding protein [Rhodospirillum rubrum]|uniref:molybdate ABC transporter substrate-binding protein n=1 Tax=Rhodospirillum rubrum TaxID=1085 RepID=UPI001902C461|nr:molybdate ABC transporter substrate-binding protein [Rhodospirillum rubrum]MBK1664013.1 molybdate ABC transporter substrate-binding protein [Rhodospirillum rubrum]MBK1675429.1 molybdate ABC transporter substrate-binding protein [Rhodospirillum rubrum]
MHIGSLRGLLAAGSLALVLAAPAAQAEELTVFAAASTTNALTDIVALFNDTGAGPAVASFASSSTLAKQIEQGAPAGVFLSADQKWMDYLDEKGLIAKDSRADLLGNRLALIAPANSALTVAEVSSKTDFPALLGEGRLAVGDPDHVPVGIYTKEAFTKLGLWDGVANKLAPANDVRGALTFVERGESPLGVVYSTDSAVSEKVKTLALLPESSHKPVTYPVATVKAKDTKTARAFVDFLKGAEAKAVFERYGFQVKP